MPTIFTHAAVAVAAGSVVDLDGNRRKILVTGMACSMLPDLDVIAFTMGIDYEAMLGHRGLSHSLAFAILVGWLVLRFRYRELRGVKRFTAFAYFTILTASHGLFDALTNGGEGIAFFAPFTGSRYFFDSTPILVSPIGLHFFTSTRGLAVIWSEILWVWLPLLTVVLGIRLIGLGRKAGARIPS